MAADTLSKPTDTELWEAYTENGMRTVVGILAKEGNSQIIAKVIDSAMETTGQARPEINYAIAELVDDHVLSRDEGMLHRNADVHPHWLEWLEAVETSTTQ